MQGYYLSVPDESNQTELNPARIHSENKIIIDLSEENPLIRVKIFMGSNRLLDEAVENAVNNDIDRAPEHAKEAVIKGMLEIITHQVNQIMNS
jgi:hypothetical protein